MKLFFIRSVIIAFAATGLFTTAANAGNPGISPRIIGGEVAPEDAYPWAVALLRPGFSTLTPPGALFCGGSLIQPRWVLTAAHCVKALTANGVDVAVGIESLQNITPSDRIAVSRIYMHPAYDSDTLDNDLALLRLAAPSSNLPLALADDTLMDGLSAGALLTTLGWGATTYNSNIPSGFPDLLQHVGLELVDFNSCDAAYTRSLTNNMICAGAPPVWDKDTCAGDSGGALIYQDNDNWYQTGITSFGRGCAVLDVAGVYTRVANYTQWIRDTTTVALTPAQAFGPQGIDRSTQKILELVNYSGANISLTALTLSGSSSFKMVDETCTSTAIADAGNCTITVEFLPDRVGQHSATVVATFNAQETRRSILTGSGLDSINATQALDDSADQSWYSGGDARWSSVCTSGNVNGSALRSGVIDHSETSTIITYATGPMALTFRWKASTEPDFDYAHFYVDGVRKASISGETGWVPENIPISGEGEHVLRWSYEKDYAINANRDTVWLDAINTEATTANTSTVCGGGGGGGSPGPLWLLLLPLLWSRASRSHNHIG